MCTFWGALLCFATEAFAVDKGTISAIQKILDAEEQSRTKLDTKLIDSIKDMQGVSATENSGDILESALSRAETKINSAKDALAENHARIEFLNSFMGALETVGDARTDGPKALGDLAHKDVLSSMETDKDSKTWLFEIYLSIAIRDIMEPSENFADFVKKYMNFSSLREPRTPADFVKDRKYLTGPGKLSKTDDKD